MQLSLSVAAREACEKRNIMFIVDDDSLGYTTSVIRYRKWNSVVGGIVSSRSLDA